VYSPDGGQGDEAADGRAGLVVLANPGGERALGTIGDGDERADVPGGEPLAGEGVDVVEDVLGARGGADLRHRARQRISRGDELDGAMELGEEDEHGGGPGRYHRGGAL
jgi:hypothetical protein